MLLAFCPCAAGQAVQGRAPTVRSETNLGAPRFHAPVDWAEWLDGLEGDLWTGHDPWLLFSRTWSAPRTREVGLATTRSEFAPQLSFVVRDWGVSRALFGGSMGVADRVRLSRSSRMLVTRFSFDARAFAPFVHVALGQWRIDTEVLPVFARDEWMAGQLALGLEMKVGAWALAGQFDFTRLHRGPRELPSPVGEPQIWGAFVGARALF
ncbi:MAG: hypothetical protein WCI05_18165 [Myxococcales bacterium]